MSARSPPSAPLRTGYSYRYVAASLRDLARNVTSQVRLALISPPDMTSPGSVTPKHGAPTTSPQHRLNATTPGPATPTRSTPATPSRYDTLSPLFLLRPPVLAIEFYVRLTLPTLRRVVMMITSSFFFIPSIMLKMRKQI